jgi:hypothetical protein
MRCGSGAAFEPRTTKGECPQFGCRGVCLLSQDPNINLRSPTDKEMEYGNRVVSHGCRVLALRARDTVFDFGELYGELWVTMRAGWLGSVSKV